MRHLPRWIECQSILVDDSDRPLIEKYKWAIMRFSHDTQYICTKIDKKKVRLHDVILGFPTYRVAHINGNTMDNRRCNLTNRNNMIRGSIVKWGKKFRVGYGDQCKYLIGIAATREEAVRLLREQIPIIRKKLWESK